MPIYKEEEINRAIKDVKDVTSVMWHARQLHPDVLRNYQALLQRIEELEASLREGAALGAVAGKKGKGKGK